MNKGIIMCNYKTMRKEYGTMDYTLNETSIKNDKNNYIEIYKHIKKEKKKKENHGKTKKQNKKVTFQIEAKSAIEKEIEKSKLPEEIKDINDIEEELKEKTIDQILQKENFFEDLPEQEDPEEQEEPEEQVEQEEKEEEQEGGRLNMLKKRIYISDLSVEKDKEMFQM